MYSDTSNPSIIGAQLRGFLLDRGRYVRLDFPGAVTSQALDINDRGQMVGEYQDGNGRFHGYLRQRAASRPSTCPASRVPPSPPGSTTGARSPDRPVPSRPGSGSCWTGAVHHLRVPGAQVTFAFGINDHGQIVGFSAASLTATTASGFLRQARGPITAINRPGAIGTAAFDINNRDQIAIIAPSPPPTDPAPMGPHGLTIGQP